MSTAERRAAMVICLDRVWHEWCSAYNYRWMLKSTANLIERKSRRSPYNSLEQKFYNSPLFLIIRQSSFPGVPTGKVTCLSSNDETMITEWIK